jgi:hypothetical protein
VHVFALVYVVYSSEIILFCWFGSQEFLFLFLFSVISFFFFFVITGVNPSFWARGDPDHGVRERATALED